MAGRKIAGITIELNADTNPFVKGIKALDTQLKNTQNNLKDVNKLLKLDPGNTELLSQKQKNLQSAIKDTQTRLNELKSAQTDALSPEDYDKLQREIIETEQNLKSLKDQYKDFGSVAGQKLQAVGKDIKESGAKIAEFGGKLTTHVTAPILAMGAAATAAFNEVDEGADAILVATGATDDALEAMEQSMKNIATEIPTDFKTAGDAIGAVNTRFGVTGKTLEDLSGTYVKFAKLNDTDVVSAVNSSQKALDAFDLSANDADKYLNVLTKAAQDTGASVDSLIGDVVQNSAAFKQMGLNIYQSTNFLGQLDKRGIESSTVMSGLSKALKAATKDGKPLNKALADLQKEIKGGKNATDGLNKAYEIFGKSGAQIYEAVRSGAIDFTQLAGAAEDAGGVIDKTFDATLDPADRFQQAMNAMKITGAEIAGVVMPTVSEILLKVRDVVMDLRERWNALTEGQQKMILAFAGIAAAAGPVITVIGKLTSGFGGVVSTVGKLVGKIGPAMSGISAPMVAAGAAVAALAAAFIHLWNTNEEFRDKMIALWERLKEVVGGFVELFGKYMEKVKATFAPVLEGLQAAWDGFCNMLAPVFEGAFGFVIDAVETGFKLILDSIRLVTDLFSGDFADAGRAVELIWKNIWDFITKTFTNIGKTIMSVNWTKLGNDIWNKITGAFSRLGGWFKEKFEAARGFIEKIDWPLLGMNVRAWITGAFLDIASWFESTFVNVWTAVASVDWLGLGKAIWDWIVDAFNSIGEWFYEKFSEIIDSVQEIKWAELGTTIWDTIKTGIGSIFDWLKERYDEVVQRFGEIEWAKLGADIWQGIQNGVGAIWDWLKERYDEVVQRFGEIDWAKLGADIWQGIQNGVGAIWDWLKERYDDAMQKFTEIDWAKLGAAIWQGIQNGVGAIWDWLKERYDDAMQKFTEIDWAKLGAAIWQGIQNGVGAIWDWLKARYDDAMQKFTEIDWAKLGAAIWQGIQNGVGAIWDWLKARYDDAMQKFTEIDWAKLGAAIWQGIGNGIGSILEWIKEKFNEAKEKISEIDFAELGRNIWEKITNGISEKWEDAKTWGKDLVDNLAEGMESGWETAKESAKNLAQIIKDFLGFSQPKEGPLSDFDTYAPDMIDLFIKGIKDQTYKLQQTIDAVANNIATKFERMGETTQQRFSAKFNGGGQLINSMLGAFQRAYQRIESLNWEGLGNRIVKSVQRAFRELPNYFKSVFDFSHIHVKMPHFNVHFSDVGFGVRIPNISVSWYRKAYDNPLLFTRPTVLPTPGGLKGFGDGPGGEVVLSTAKLKELVGSGGDQYFNFTINAQPGQSAQDIARAVERIFVRQQKEAMAAHA